MSPARLKIAVVGQVVHKHTISSARLPGRRMISDPGIAGLQCKKGNIGADGGYGPFRERHHSDIAPTAVPPAGAV